MKPPDPPTPLARLRAGARFRLNALWRERILPWARLRWNAGRELEPIFVAGAMGSGTTLLAVAMGQRFDVAGAVTESARQIARRSPLWVDATERFPSVRAYQEAIERVDGEPDRLRADLLDLYRARARYPGRRVLDKGPNTNLVRADLLSRLFPAAPFVLIFRDPVANIEGFRRKWASFGQDALEESIRFYREIHERFLHVAAARRLPLHVVEYEALVEELEPALDRLAGALGLGRAPEARPLDDRPDEGVRGIRRVRGGAIQVERDATRRSYRSLEPGEVEKIRTELSDLHGRLQEAARRTQRDTWEQAG